MTIRNLRGHNSFWHLMYYTSCLINIDSPYVFYALTCNSHRISDRYDSRASSATTHMISHSTFSCIFFSAYPRASSLGYKISFSVRSTTTRSNHRSGKKSHCPAIKSENQAFLLTCLAVGRPLIFCRHLDNFQHSPCENPPRFLLLTFGLLDHHIFCPRQERKCLVPHPHAFHHVNPSPSRFC